VFQVLQDKTKRVQIVMNHIPFFIFTINITVYISKEYCIFSISPLKSITL